MFYFFRIAVLANLKSIVEGEDIKIYIKNVTFCDA